MWILYDLCCTGLIITTDDISPFFKFWAALAAKVFNSLFSTTILLPYFGDISPIGQYQGGQGSIGVLSREFWCWWCWKRTWGAQPSASKENLILRSTLKQSIHWLCFDLMWTLRSAFILNLETHRGHWLNVNLVRKNLRWLHLWSGTLLRFMADN